MAATLTTTYKKFDTPAVLSTAADTAGKASYAKS